MMLFETLLNVDPFTLSYRHSLEGLRFSALCIDPITITLMLNSSDHAREPYFLNEGSSNAHVCWEWTLLSVVA